VSALILGFLEWLGGIIASDLIAKLKSYIENKIKEKEAAAALKIQIQKDIEKLKQAKTEKEFDDASKDVLDNF
jgi:predicted alpha/beta-fold hydrolase